MSCPAFLSLNGAYIEDVSQRLGFRQIVECSEPLYVTFIKSINGFLQRDCWCSLA